MQVDQISLNALRVFLTVAEHGSHTSAAGVLGVTPGAVSRQVSLLEQALGVALFERRNNAITLTSAGATLHARAAPGLSLLHSALSDIQRDSHSVTLSVSATLAARWLIPRLDRFQTRHKQARLSLITTRNADGQPDPLADVSLTYCRAPDLPPEAEIVIPDRCRPYVSPALLYRLKTPQDIATLPILQTASDNWDWALWAGETGQSTTSFTITGTYDLDDTALRACVAGLGAVLSPAFLVADDLATGRLIPLPGAPEALLGGYLLSLTPIAPPMAARLATWLRAECQSVTA